MDKPDKTSNEPYKNNWEQHQGKGKGKFILIYGVIGMGLFPAIILSLVEIVLGLFSGTIDWDFMLNYLIGFPILGIFLGLWYWKHNEKKYQKWITGRE